MNPNSKSIDNIINASNIFKFLSEAKSDKTNVDVSNSNISKPKIESSLLSLLKAAGFEEDDLQARAISQVSKESYSPYVKQMEYDLKNVFLTARPYFRTDKNSQPFIKDTVYVQPGNLDNLFEELAHSVQYGNLSTEDVKALGARTRLEKKEYGEDRYNMPNTMENEAHRLIEPALLDRYKTILDSLRSVERNEFNQWNKNNPRNTRSEYKR